MGGADSSDVWTECPHTYVRDLTWYGMERGWEREKKASQHARSHILARNSEKLMDSNCTPGLPCGSHGISAGLEGWDMFSFSFHGLALSATNVRTGLFSPLGI